MTHGRHLLNLNSCTRLDIAPAFHFCLHIPYIPCWTSHTYRVMQIARRISAGLTAGVTDGFADTHRLVLARFCRSHFRLLRLPESQYETYENYYWTALKEKHLPWESNVKWDGCMCQNNHAAIVLAFTMSNAFKISLIVYRMRKDGKQWHADKTPW